MLTHMHSVFTLLLVLTEVCLVRIASDTRERGKGCGF